MLRTIKIMLRNTPIVLQYGLILAAGIVLLKTIEYRLFSFRINHELYSGLLAVFFLLIGMAAGYALLKPRAGKTSVPSSITQALTATERRLLAGLLEGHTNQQLADGNHVSVNTVKTHLKNIYRKLNVSNRAEAVALAREQSLV